MRWGIGMVVTLSLLVAACGGSAPVPTSTPTPAKTSSPIVGTVTYWSLGRSPGAQVLELVKRPDGYLVAWNGGRPHPPLALHGHALVLSRSHTVDTGNGSTVSLPGVELIPEGATLILVTHVTGQGAAQRDTLVPLTRHAYLAALASYREEMVREWTDLLSGALQTWAGEHGNYPPPDALQPDTPFGQLVARQMLSGLPQQMKKTQPAWPINPYTTEPMHSGTQPGDFTYRLQGEGYVLAGHLGNGRDYTVRSP